MQVYLFFAACHSNYSVLNGHVRYTDRRIIYNETVPVVCDSGYEVQGKGFARCLANGSWSNDTWCRIKGMLVYFLRVLHHN